MAEKDMADTKPCENKVGMGAQAGGHQHREEAECKTSFDKIELRSEKVRTILRDAPTKTLRWSTAVLLAIVAMLLAVVLFAPYPYGGGESILGHYFP